MKKNGSVCVLALIFIISVCVEMKPVEYLSKFGYLAVNPGSNWHEKLTSEEIVKAILKFQSFNGLPQTGIIDETTANKMYAQQIGVKDINAYKTDDNTEEAGEMSTGVYLPIYLLPTGLLVTKETRWPQTLLNRRSTYSRKSRYPSDQQRRSMSRAFYRLDDVMPRIEKTRVRQTSTNDLRFENEGEKSVGFCNYSYNSLDAAMRVEGNDFVFVDNGEVIDGRNGQKVAVESLFPEGPTWVQAAVYSQKGIEAYLFKDDKIWVYMFHIGNDKFIHRGIFQNYIKHSHSPECAMMYYDRIYLLKNQDFFRFRPYVNNPDQHGNKTIGGFAIRTSVDAAISSGYDIKFIVKDKVYKLTPNVGVEVIRIKQTNQVFNKCKK